MTPQAIANLLQAAGKKVRQSGPGKWQAQCPAHDDRNPSLSIAAGEGGRALIHCHAGCHAKDVAGALGLTMKDLAGEAAANNGNGKAGRRIVATYPYTDAEGELLYEVVRYEPKDFLQRRPDGKGGYIWKTTGVRRVLYRLPDLLAAAPDAVVFVAEGEKDVENLTARGLVATCNAEGANKWHTLADDSALHGRHVCIIADKDARGREHGADVAKRLQGKAASVKVIEVPGDACKDASDYLSAGGDAAGLLKLYEAAPAWTGEQAATITPAKLPESYTPFPSDALPIHLRRLVDEGAGAMKLDRAFIALPLLAACAGAIGNARTLTLKEGWQEPANIWAALIAPSGTLKTPALNLALDGLRIEHKRLRAEYEAAMKDYNARTDEERGDPPVDARVTASDVTVEQLAVLLQRNPRGLLIEREELSGWLRSFNQYKSKGGGDEAHWLSMFNAGPLQVDRKTGEHKSIYVARASVSLCGGIQPGVLRDCLGADKIESGMAARLLLAMPPVAVRQWTDETVCIATRGAVETIMRALLSLAMMPGPYGPEPVTLPLTAEARALFIAFVNAHGEEMQRTDGALRAAWSKLEGYAARLALIVHCVRQVSEGAGDAVDDESMAAGITLARWFAGEAKRVYAMLAESAGEQKRRELIEFIRARGGSITASKLCQYKTGYASADDARMALQSLVDAGAGRFEYPPPSASGGRPSEVFILAT